MLLREIQYKDEYAQCVKMHMAWNDWLCQDYKTCLSYITMMKQTKQYVRVVVDEGKENRVYTGRVLGYMIGGPTVQIYTPFKWFSQIMCYVDVKGPSGVRVLKMLHDDLFKYGEDHGFPIVNSVCSHLDEELKFSKVLERMGWERRGYMAAKATKHYAAAAKLCSHQT